MEDVFEDVFDQKEKLELPLRPIYIWLSLFFLSALAYWFSVPGYLFYTLLSSSGVVAVSLAWIIYFGAKSRFVLLSMVFSFVIVGFWVMQAFFIHLEGIHYRMLPVMGVVFLVLFVFYEIYKRSILKRLKNAANGLLSVRNDNIFDAIGLILIGGFLILFGLSLLLKHPLVGLFMLTLGGLLVTTKHGIEIDCENQFIRDYVSYYGLRRGKWKSYSGYTDLALLSGSGKRKNKLQPYVKGSRAKNVSLYILTEDHSEKKLIYRFKRNDKPLEEVSDLAKRMRLIFTSYSPVQTED